MYSPENFLKIVRATASGDAPLNRSTSELLPVDLYQIYVVSAREGATEVVGLSGAEAGDVYSQLVHLVLKEDYPQGPSQRPFFQGVVELPLSPVDVSLDKQADAVVGSDPGAYRGDLVRHFREIARLDSRYGLYLGRRLHLEYPDGVALVEHVVDARILEIDAREVRVPARSPLDELQGLLHLR